jgi:xylitol oxidase
VTAVVQRNWAGNIAYSARGIAHPSSITEAQDLVANAPRVRALGTRHSFNDCADAPGLLVSLDRLPVGVDIDESTSTVTVPAAARTGDFVRQIDHAGLALHNTGSLPHISIAGAISTGTHGSGDSLGSLASAVTGLQFIGPDGELRWVTRSDPEFAGSVVSIGALGVITRVTLEVQPSYRIRQDEYTGLPWASLLEHLDDITSSAYSVSVFLHWSDDATAGMVLKSRGTEPPDDLFGARRRPVLVEPGGEAPDNRTELGSWGPWWDRLPHFRLDAVPSNGDELQTEYFLPRATAPTALAEVKRLGARLDEALHASEIRTVAADGLWLSGAYESEAVCLHFTWKNRPDVVASLLRDIEERLLPLGARPHWGKLFAAGRDELRNGFEHWDDFAALRDRVDPQRKFANSYLDRLFPESASP